MKLKKALALIAAVVTLGASLTACGDAENSTSESESSSSETTTEETTEPEATTESEATTETVAESNKSEEESSEERDLEVEQNGDTTTITVPASLITDLDATIAEAEADDGIVSYTVNDDGSVTYVYTSETYQANMAEMRDSFESTVSEALSSGTYQTIVSITGDDDLKNVDITVSSQQEYESSMDGLIMIGLYVYTGYYQVFCGESENYSTVFHIIDNSTGSEFDTVTYPDDIG